LCPPLAFLFLCTPTSIVLCVVFWVVGDFPGELGDNKHTSCASSSMIISDNFGNWRSFLVFADDDNDDIDELGSCCSNICASIVFSGGFTIVCDIEVVLSLPILRMNSSMSVVIHTVAMDLT
jgi:hypothetical protein